MKHIHKIFDLHCDTLTECHKRGVGFTANQLSFNLERLPENVHLCQAMAIFMPDDLRGAAAIAYFDSLYKIFMQQIIMHGERVEQVLASDAVDGILDYYQFAMMLTVEGGSVLAGNLERLRKLCDLGVKMMTLTWNAENEIAGGAATDKGFTSFGHAVVTRMEELGMVVDVSHLSDRGFFELCKFARKPFVASHSNSRSVCNHRRNLTDEMFAEICQRGGLVGLNYCESFLVEGGNSKTVDDILRHVHHFLELGGEDVLALGSDYDGADVPVYLDGIEKQIFLREAFICSGISEQIVDKIFYENARCFFANIEPA